MANPFLGRTATFTPAGEGVPLLGMRTKSFSMLGEPIDISDDDSDGWTEFLTESPKKGVSLQVEGLTKSKELLVAIAQAGGVLELVGYVLEFTSPDWAIAWSGNWVISGFSVQLEHEGVSSFSATIQSNGALTFDNDSTT